MSMRASEMLAREATLAALFSLSRRDFATFIFQRTSDSGHLPQLNAPPAKKKTAAAVF
jgi:hypothetical protein